MSCDDPAVEGTATLKGNPWIDFRGPAPRLVTRPLPPTASPPPH